MYRSVVSSRLGRNSKSSKVRLRYYNASERWVSKSSVLTSFRPRPYPNVCEIYGRIPTVNADEVGSHLRSSGRKAVACFVREGSCTAL